MYLNGFNVLNCWSVCFAFCRVFRCQGMTPSKFSVWLEDGGSEQGLRQFPVDFEGPEILRYILQGTNISHLGKRKIIFKIALSGGYVNFLEGIHISQKSFCHESHVPQNKLSLTAGGILDYD